MFKKLFIFSIGIFCIKAPVFSYTALETDNFVLSIDSYLRSFARPVGKLNEEGKYLSKELGYETDLFIDYQLNKHILVSVLGGYFLPGRYYKELRDDATGSLFNPFVRGDGDVDSAYQVELAIEFQF